MDNQYNQTEVAYENGPKEVNRKRGMPSGDAQFGKHKMPQDSKPAKKEPVTKNMERHASSMRKGQGRHKELR